MPSSELVRRLRRNRGRLLRPEYVSEIAKLLQRPVDSLTLLDLEDTERLDRLVGEVRHRTQGVFHKMFIVLPDRADNGQAAEAWETIRRLCRNIPDEPLVLIRNLSEYCGAVEVRLSEVCEHAAELATWNQEQLRATRKDGSAGLVLYLHVDRPGFKQPTEEVYDLWIWGDDWIDAVTSATGTMD